MLQNILERRLRIDQASNLSTFFDTKPGASPSKFNLLRLFPWQLDIYYLCWYSPLFFFSSYVFQRTSWIVTRCCFKSQNDVHFHLNFLIWNNPTDPLLNALAPCGVPVPLAGNHCSFKATQIESPCFKTHSQGETLNPAPLCHSSQSGGLCVSLRPVIGQSVCYLFWST